MLLPENDSLLLTARKVTRAFFLVRGLARIAEVVRRYYARHSSKTILVDDYHGNLKFYCELHKYITSQIFWRGHSSDGQLILVDRALKADSVFFDVGANIGEFTLTAASKLNAGTVYAFEPSGVMMKKLQANIAVNAFSNIKTFNFGFSDTSKTLPIYSCPNIGFDGTLNDGALTLYRTDNVCELLEQVKLEVFDTFVETNKIDKMDVLKIDVEGAELSVLKGAARSIERFKPVIMIEVNDLACTAAGYDGREILRFLERIGYRLMSVHEKGRTRPLSSGGKVSALENVIAAHPEGKQI